MDFPEGYEVLDGYVYGYYPNGRIQAGTNLEPVVLKSSTVKPSNPLEKPESQLNVLMKSSSGELIEFSTPLNLNTEAYAGLGNTKDKPIVIAVGDGEQLEPEFITQDLEAAYFASNNGITSSYSKEDGTYWLPKSNGFATYQFFNNEQFYDVINGIVKINNVSLYLKDVNAANELSGKTRSNRHIPVNDYLDVAGTLTVAVSLPTGESIIDDLSFDIIKHKSRDQNLYNHGTIASLNADIEGRVYSTINYNISSNPNLDAASSSSITLLDVNTLPNLPESYKVSYEQFNTATFTNIQVSIKEAFVNDFFFGDGDMMVEQSLVILEL